MAVVIMGGDDNKPILHDFLAVSCGYSSAAVAEVITTPAMEAEASISAGVSSIGHGFNLGISNPVSERHAVSNSEAFLIPGKKDGSFGHGDSNTYSGRKRSNLAQLGFITNKIGPACEDASESSRSQKMFGKEVICDRLGRNQEENVQLAMQIPPRPASLHSLFSSRPALLSSKWEQPIPMNPGSVVHYPFHIAQKGLFSSSHASKDANVSAILMSQPVTDEASRTGIKGSPVLNVSSSSSQPGERNSIARVLPFSSIPKSAQSYEPESSNALRYHGKSNVCRQMTIFYAGQAHVFDNVHPNKAEVIMALAGSTGGSWSTTISQKKPVMCASAGEVKVPTEEIQRNILSFPSSIQRNSGHVLSEADRTTFNKKDIPSLPAGGGQTSGRALRDEELVVQADLSSSEGKRNET